MSSRACCSGALSVTQLSLDLTQAAVHGLHLLVLVKDTYPLLAETMVLVTHPLSVHVHCNGQPLILIHACALGCHDARVSSYRLNM
jgi:hypothetical protein